ncbi:GNAT family N-acetyltransferase [Paenarthrobacter sp. Z7-10]|uniref:GNAT family N-acetyltransferase n=1 Tax=Paenarthrobacter sp. Z7-10 TaxID=2787635 RepID=UPI0022A92A9B|nr:GNAT family N-acetyltransferase [Paenarthrobacter sp. Z7-10]MCZ2402861.1 GNAT family N-acetyltransferase [Paenarthrobacter sp. Z7-10]
MSGYETKALTSETWDAFADLCARHNGAGMGGCWCTWFHRETHSAPGTSPVPRSADNSRDFKRRLVETGHAHAALVFDGEVAVGWAQYGSPDELPGIAHRKEYLEWVEVLPDYRITCFFVDRRSRRSGVASAALGGVLKLIAAAGGGMAEAYPQDTPGKKVSATFLYSATRGMFERAGFAYQRPKGKNHCIMRKVIDPG